LIERLLIVGYGSIGRRHVRIARALLPYADIRILPNKPLESTPEYANSCVSNLHEALAFSPQAAVIASPSTFHMQSAQPLAEAGVHLLVEKPLAANIEGVGKLIATCESRNLVLMTAYNLRFLPSLQKYRALIQSGSIGKVISVRSEIGQHLSLWRPNLDYRQSVSASRKLGGGVLLELSHEIDYLRWIFGEVEWVLASLTKQSDLEIDVEDCAHLILGFDPDFNGRKLVANLSMDFIRQDTTRQCLAIGVQGSLRWCGLTGDIEMFPAAGTAWESIFCIPAKPEESYKLEWIHFLDCINDGSKPLVDGQDGISVLRIVEAARISAFDNNVTLVQKKSQV